MARCGDPTSCTQTDVSCPSATEHALAPRYPLRNPLRNPLRPHTGPRAAGADGDRPRHLCTSPHPSRTSPRRLLAPRDCPSRLRHRCDPPRTREEGTVRMRRSKTIAVLMTLGMLLLTACGSKTPKTNATPTTGAETSHKQGGTVTIANEQGQTWTCQFNPFNPA